MSQRQLSEPRRHVSTDEREDAVQRGVDLACDVVVGVEAEGGRVGEELNRI